MTQGHTTAELQRQLALLHAGDESARRALIGHACDRLRKLTRKMIQDYPSVHAMEETDDVLQNSLIRLDKALSKETPATLRHFFNLAAKHIRWELLDLAKRCCGQGSEVAVSEMLPEKFCDEPSNLMEWTEFHEKVESLPEREREVFNLLWYEELSQDEAAEVLDVSRRTIIRRWQKARFILSRMLYGERISNEADRRG